MEVFDTVDIDMEQVIGSACACVRACVFVSGRPAHEWNPPVWEVNGVNLNPLYFLRFFCLGVCRGGHGLCWIRSGRPHLPLVYTWMITLDLTIQRKTDRNSHFLQSSWVIYLWSWDTDSSTDICGGTTIFIKGKKIGEWMKIKILQCVHGHGSGTNMCTPPDPSWIGRGVPRRRTPPLWDPAGWTSAIVLHGSHTWSFQEMFLLLAGTWCPAGKSKLDENKS